MASPIPSSAFIKAVRDKILSRQRMANQLTSRSSRGQNQNRSGMMRGDSNRQLPSEPLMQTPATVKGRPRLLLMGQRRSGKSSISSVVFHKLAPQETLFLESTARIQNDQMTSFMDIQVWDFPGQIDIIDNPSFDMEAIFGELGALIWVIDAQDDYLEAVERLNATILALQDSYPHINIEVFIHKVDGLSDDYRLDIQRDITIRVQDELSDQGVENAPVNFHMTSIYNHSIFEAFSKVIQKLIPRLGTLETMLTDLCRTCHFEKAYLFDVVSKIYIATDNSPADMPSYEICSDYIDVILDISEVFGSWTRPAENATRLEGNAWAEGAPPKIADQVAYSGAESCLVLHDTSRPIMLREVDKHLALVAIMKEESYAKMPLVTMNVEIVAKGLQQFFEITKKK
ncbi:GTP-binding protein gtr2 [Ceratocystis pirilliformis]|uniref:GTP-binding protein n=1 Tax=Ceratocystis pirilliformis TaxID=259994 RepID=A0ABR3YTG1_9PEZI